MSKRAGRYVLVVIVGGFIESLVPYVDLPSARRAADKYRGRLDFHGLDDAVIWDVLENKAAYVPHD